MPRFGQEQIWRRSLPAHLARPPAEGGAEDPEGDPEHARPRAGEDRDEPKGKPAAFITLTLGWKAYDSACRIGGQWTCHCQGLRGS